MLLVARKCKVNHLVKYFWHHSNLFWKLKANGELGESHCNTVHQTSALLFTRYLPNGFWLAVVLLGIEYYYFMEICYSTYENVSLYHTIFGCPCGEPNEVGSFTLYLVQSTAVYKGDHCNYKHRQQATFCILWSDLNQNKTQIFFSTSKLFMFIISDLSYANKLMTWNQSLQDSREALQ